LQYTARGGSYNKHYGMIAFSHRFTFGLCLSVIVLTASVVASMTLALQKYHDNSVLYHHISTLKAENNSLREQLRRLSTRQADSRRLATPAGADSGHAGASDS